MNINIEGKLYDSRQVVESLKEQVTTERWNKIQKVISRRNKYLATVVENLYDKGNTSAVMRSAEAFGYHNFHHIEEIDTFKDSRRVSKGAEKWLIQSKWPKTRDCIQNLKDKGYLIYVTQLEGGVPIQEVSFEQPVALCFGSERDGASEQLSQLADKKVFIPMEGFVQSFNISVAAALCFQHVHRTHKSLNLGNLSEEEQVELQAHYLYRSCQTPDPYLPPPNQ